MLKLKENIKTLWFITHEIGMYTVPYFWILSKYFLYIYLIIILSWILNNNKCLLTQIEYYFFGETFMGKGKQFHVPLLHRSILYVNFIIGIIYYSFFKDAL
jgi:hypothetical protein